MENSVIITAENITLVQVLFFVVVVSVDLVDARYLLKTIFKAFQEQPPKYLCRLMLRCCLEYIILEINFTLKRDLSFMK